MITTTQEVQTKAWRAVKVALTRAEKTKDPSAIHKACDHAESVFNTIGWPDWWSRVERMRTDAASLPAPGACRDCGEAIPMPATASKYDTLCGSCLVTYV